MELEKFHDTENATIVQFLLIGVVYFNKTVKVAYKVSIYVFWYVFIYDSTETNRDNRLSLD